MMEYSVPLAIYFELTERCNLRCRHCYLSPSLGSGAADLDDQSMLAIFKKIVGEEIFRVVLTGGEPLVRFDLIEQILNCREAARALISINTNLLLFNERMIPAFQKTRGLIVSCVSVNETKYRHLTQGGELKQLEASLKILVDNHIDFGVNMVVSKDNLGEIKEEAIKMETLGCRFFSASPMLYCTPSESLKESILSHKELIQVFEDLLWIAENTSMAIDSREAIPKCALPRQLLERDLPFLIRGCQAGRRSVAISSSGHVRPCPNQHQVYGNILKESLEAIYRRMEDWRRGDYLPDGCKSCAALFQCYGACRAQSEAYFKKPHHKDIWATQPFEISPFGKSITSPLEVNTILYPYRLTKVTDDHIRWRSEGNSYLVFNDASSLAVLVSRHYIEFIENLRDNYREGFTFMQLARDYAIDIQDINFKRILNDLIKIGILSQKAGEET